MRVLLGVAALLVPGMLLAQGDCFPPDDSHEAQAFGIFSVPLAFGPVRGPAPLGPWRLRAALEVSYLPNVDDSTATPTVCRPGKGPENTDFGPALVRPRLSLGLPSGFILEASWVPPVRVKGAKPNLLGLAVGRSFLLPRTGMRLGVRVHATAGVIHAPVTCDQDALEDANSECFMGTLSDDEFHPNIFGADATLGWSLGGGVVEPFLGGGVNVLHPKFRVNFTNQQGQTDRRRVEVDLTRAVLFAGATWQPGRRIGVSGMIYSAPADAVTGRLALSVGL